MKIPELPQRHSIARAKFFINLADQCPVAERDNHEAFMEAAIVFCRAAIHRLRTRYKKSPDWKTWFESLRGNPSIEFIKEERDWILKEAPPKVGQRIILGTPVGQEVIDDSPIEKAKHLYYFVGETDKTAIDTVRRHIDEIERIVREGEHNFWQHGIHPRLNFCGLAAVVLPGHESVD